ncbi:FG-nucleoporin nsp1 [Pseudogymnoascus destructans]|uniref:Nucleoporin NSP1 n=2 Tax=Pseudogymnoascus destructans TaxID=655981 RepID=L8FZJ9_PSED2|nr:FG-nucleoporin nsp1 [Pseudogymnoascus destructans]ELR06292.1 hypothetical protein GMDG_07884 [Pseudogymnoascus destructans 20631-21]OAF58535.1 FG-nucleoporin nsp1 [Pseudogymnoascus destructans]
MSFSFGAPGGTGGNLFGQSTTPASSGAPTTGLFGQPTAGATDNKQTSGGLFGGGGAAATTKPGGFSFGATPASTGPSNMFGGGAAKPAASAPLFGSAATTTAPAGRLFGATTSGATAGATPAAAPAGGLFGGGFQANKQPSSFGNFSFGQSATQNPPSSTPTTSSFPTPSKPETPAAPANLFGAASKSAGAPAAAPTLGSTTPAPNKPAGSMSSFPSSTTPAGTPAGGNAAAPSLFGGLNKPAAPAGGGLFGGPKPAAAAAPPASAAPAPGGLFGAAKPAAPATGGLFGGAMAAKPPAAPATTAAAPTGTTPASSAPAAAAATTATPSLFGGGAAAPPKAGGLFGGAAATTAAAAPASTTAPAPAAPAASSLFGATAATSAAAPPTAAVGAAPATGLFGAKPAAISGATPSTAAPATVPAAAAATAPVAINPNVSTAGPAPQMSRLKNRTMDEIINRWASDLSKYQKDFQEQATKVASWDRLLVENGDKIQKLYVSTFEAERATSEVEKQLTAVENMQGELEGWLDRYEKDVDELFNRNLGSSDNLQGPDQERERMYKLAEKLAGRLDDMGKDLTSMIQEINTASSSLSKAGKPDDPLQQIVKVLNGHLSQLQWIDQNAAALQAKVAAAQKEGRSLGASIHGDNESEASHEMLRSYLGRR